MKLATVAVHGISRVVASNDGIRLYDLARLSAHYELGPVGFPAGHDHAAEQWPDSGVLP